MNFEERGKYITILCIMHQSGRLSLDQINTLVGSLSVNLSVKFRLDEHGLYFNERLEEEIEKRKKFTESRRLNGKKGGNKASAYPNGYPIGYPKYNHMENENENVIINDNVVISLERGAGENLSFYEKSIIDEIWIEAIQRVCKVDEIKAIQFVKDFNSYLQAAPEHHNTINDWRRHATNWIKNEIKKNATKPTNPNTGERKSAVDKQNDGLEKWRAIVAESKIPIVK